MRLAALLAGTVLASAAGAAAELAGTERVRADAKAVGCPGLDDAPTCEARLDLEAAADPAWCDPLGCILLAHAEARGEGQAPLEHLHALLAIGGGGVILCEGGSLGNEEGPITCTGDAILDVEIAAGECLPVEGLAEAGATGLPDPAGVGALGVTASVDLAFCRDAAGAPHLALDD